MAMVAAPLLVLFLPHELVPPLIIMLSLINLLIALYPVRRHIIWRLVRRLMYGALPGLPVGVWLLYWLDANQFKLVLGILVVFAAVLMLTGWKIKLAQRSIGWSVTGFISGVLSTSTALSGPPVIFAVASNQENVNSFRANLLAYFAVLNAFSILAFTLGGTYNTGSATGGPLAFPFDLAAVLLVPLVAGTSLGVWAATRISAPRFKQIVLWILAALGVFVTVSAVM